jgi:hypothetical protein
MPRLRVTPNATALLRQLTKVPDRALERALGMSPAALAECAEAAIRIPTDLLAAEPGQPQPVFSFILGANSRRTPSGSQKRNSHLKEALRNSFCGMTTGVCPMFAT